MRKGQHQTEEAKKKISEAKKGKPRSDRARNNISYGMKRYHAIRRGESTFILDNNYA